MSLICVVLFYCPAVAVSHKKATSNPHQDCGQHASCTTTQAPYSKGVVHSLRGHNQHHSLALLQRAWAKALATGLYFEAIVARPSAWFALKGARCCLGSIEIGVFRKSSLFSARFVPKYGTNKYGAFRLVTLQNQTKQGSLKRPFQTFWGRRALVGFILLGEAFCFRWAF